MDRRLAGVGRLRRSRLPACARRRPEARHPRRHAAGRSLPHRYPGRLEQRPGHADARLPARRRAATDTDEGRRRHSGFSQTGLCRCTEPIRIAGLGCGRRHCRQRTPSPTFCSRLRPPCPHLDLRLLAGRPGDRGEHRALPARLCRRAGHVRRDHLDARTHVARRTHVAGGLRCIDSRRPAEPGRSRLAAVHSSGINSHRIR